MSKNGHPINIVTEDYKYNLRNNLFDDYEKKYNFSPIIYEMGLFLEKLRYSKYKGTDRFLIAAESTRIRKTFRENLSIAFIHCFSLLEVDKKLQFRNLKKTYNYVE